MRDGQVRPVGPDPQNAATSSNEPDAKGSPLRRFRDPAYQPIATDLQALRDAIDAIDRDLVTLMARRAMLVKDAARFKADHRQVAAPARQAQVYANARALARTANLGFEGLEDVVEATWRAMVSAFIAQEGRYFDDMEPMPISPQSHPVSQSRQEKKP